MQMHEMRGRRGEKSGMTNHDKRLLSLMENAGREIEDEDLADALREKGRAVDTDGFDVAMAEQKAKARAAWSGTGEAADAAVWYDVADAHGATDFLGYDTEQAEGQILAIVKDGAQVPALVAGETGCAST